MSAADRALDRACSWLVDHPRVAWAIVIGLGYGSAFLAQRVIP